MIDEVGKFWVVTDSTKDSELKDICFQKNVIGMMTQAKGGLEEHEVRAIFKNKAKAEKFAKKEIDEWKKDQPGRPWAARSSVVAALKEKNRKDLAVRVKKIMGGTWSLPDSSSKISKIKKYLAALKKGTVLEEPTKYFNKLYGNDDFFDRLGDQETAKDKAKAYYEVITNHLADLIGEYEENPNGFNSKLDVNALRKLLK